MTTTEDDFDYTVYNVFDAMQPPQPSVPAYTRHLVVESGVGKISLQLLVCKIDAELLERIRFEDLARHEKQINMC